MDYINGRTAKDGDEVVELGVNFEPQRVAVVRIIDGQHFVEEEHHVSSYDYDNGQLLFVNRLAVGSLESFIRVRDVGLLISDSLREPPHG